MKLLWCPSCNDARKLEFDRRFCKCGRVWGYYKRDGHHAVIGGEDPRCIGIANPDLGHAYQRPDHPSLRAWMIYDSPRVEVESDD